MDWAAVKSAICEGRKFTVGPDGCRVVADVIMPSGAMVMVHIQARNGQLFMHDGGAAFDELARHALDVVSVAGVRQMLSRTGFRVNDDGFVWRDRVAVADAAVGVALVADASFRAAQWLISHGRNDAVVPLEKRAKDALRLRYPSGRADFSFQGKNRQHTFDFGVVVGDRTLLMEAVTPEPASVSSAIVKGLDARGAPGSNVVPIFIFDPADKWGSGSLNMLEFGGRGVEIGALAKGELPLAA